jgi:polysaccharide biosynthesis protein PslH
MDLCQAEFAPMLPLGVWFPREIPRLFVHHQIHFVYAERFLEVHGGCYTEYLNTVMRVQELAYLQHFDAVVTFSEKDRSALEPHLAPASVFTSPFPIPADVGVARDVPQHFDGRFLFVASDVHDPNHDALEWLISEIWPKIMRQLPSARLIVVGQWSHSWRARFAAPAVSFAGFVRDLPQTLRGGIMLVPVRIGSGIRAKILVALAQGVPVVTTAVGGEGLLARDGEELLVCEEASEFAAAAVRLAEKPALRHRLALAGRAAVCKHYSPQEVRRRRNEIYAAVIANGRHRVSSEAGIAPVCR